MTRRLKNAKFDWRFFTLRHTIKNGMVTTGNICGAIRTGPLRINFGVNFISKIIVLPSYQVNILRHVEHNAIFL